MKNLDVERHKDDLPHNYGATMIVLHTTCYQNKNTRAKPDGNRSVILAVVRAPGRCEPFNGRGQT